jgi:hypothetical protein
MFSTFNTFSKSLALPDLNLFKIIKKALLPNTFIENESFEEPYIDGQSLFYEEFGSGQQEAFRWSVGGNGNITMTGSTDFGFDNFVNGDQALAIQSKAFIQQVVYLNVGTYIFSTYFMSKHGEEKNPIQVSIGGTIIATIDKVATEWTLFTHTFNILVAGDLLLRIEGLAEEDLTTGIDLVALSFKTFPYIPIMINNTTTQQGTSGYEAQASSILGSNFNPFKAFNGNLGNFWYCKYVYSDGDYGGDVTTFVSPQVGESQSISGEWIQIKIPSAIVLKSFEIQNRQDGYPETHPKLFTLVGSNGLTDSNGEYIWEEITTISLTENPLFELGSYSTLSNTNSYSYYRLIVTKVFGGSHTNIPYFNIYGYEEGKINSNFDNLLINSLSNKKPYAYFRAIDYKDDEIPALIGDFTAETVDITKDDGKGNGADAVIPFLIGTIDSKINFNVNVPEKFTVCNITRYTSANDDNRQQVLCASTGFFLNGHWNNRRGLALYNEDFMTTGGEPPKYTNLGEGSLTDWLVMCGKNGSEPPPKNFLADNNKVGAKSGGTGGNTNIGINNNRFGPGNFSDFEFSQLLIWDSILTDVEMQDVSNYLTTYLEDGLD